jgi:hypothetical protein
MTQVAAEVWIVRVVPRERKKGYERPVDLTDPREGARSKLEESDAVGRREGTAVLVVDLEEDGKVIRL